MKNWLIRIGLARLTVAPYFSIKMHPKDCIESKIFNKRMVADHKLRHAICVRYFFWQLKNLLKKYLVESGIGFAQDGLPIISDNVLYIVHFII